MSLRTATQATQTLAPASRAAPVPAVELRNLVKHYVEPGGETVVAVNNINLTIFEGEFFSLLGPSGCGKTTTLRMIAGLELPTSGSVILYGEDVTERPAYRRPVNTVFQRYALFPHMSVRDNVAFGLRMKKTPKAEIGARVDEVLRLVRMERLGDRKPGQLSGGQQQRVALARALVNNPEVLLLDEPLGALDLKLRQAMQEELKRIQREVGITFIYVTHDQEEALTMSDRIAVMNEGVVLQVDKPYDLYEEPKSRFVADFIGETNFLSAVVVANDDEQTHVRLASGQMAHVAHEGNKLPVDLPVTLAIRPEKIFVGVGEPPRVRNVFAGTVQNIVYFGTDTYYDVMLPGNVLVTARQQNEDYTGTAASAAVGDAVYVAWRAHNASLLTE
ncbi:MAG TPA: ABC transporter ATP-binding protein [Caldilineaceae bacterium]|nr:ABC transporter ATP-binding protein [Caldilineaceae bacterium]